jgi:hypothetical protein
LEAESLVTGRITSPDLTGDLLVNLADLVLFATDYLAYNQRSDLQGDGVINLSDLSLFGNDFLIHP